MGMVRLFSSCGSDEKPIGRPFHDDDSFVPYGYRSQVRAVEPEPILGGNPDPRKFLIEKVEVVGRFLVLQVHYPDCTNYEGRKVLVFEGMTEARIRRLKTIDPHFCDHSHPSPVARFEPTSRGWDYARAFCLVATGVPSKRKPK